MKAIQFSTNPKMPVPGWKLPRRLLLGLAMVLGISSCKQEECPKKYESLVYVANEGDGTISVIDPASMEVVRTIDLGEDGSMMSPHNVQVSPSGHQIWVTAPPESHGGTEEIVVLSPRKGKIEARIEVGEEIHLAHVVLDAEGRYAYTSATETDQIFKIDAETFEVLDNYALPANCSPHGMRMTGDKLVIATLYNPGMVVLDVVTETQTIVQANGMGVQTAVTSDGQNAFVSLYDRKEVFRYNLSTQDTLRMALPSSAQGPVQLFLSPDNAILYVCDQGILSSRPASNKLYCLDATTGAVVDSVVVGNGAHGIVLSPDGQTGFVTNYQDNTVSMIDMVSLEVVATIPVGAVPNGISYLECD